jgi:hypothetical protein
LGGWRGFVANHHCLPDVIGWLGCCLCRRCKLGERVQCYSYLLKFSITPLTNSPKQTEVTLHNTMSMITKAIESAVWLNLTIKYKAKETTCLY